MSVNTIKRAITSAKRLSTNVSAGILPPARTTKTVTAFGNASLTTTTPKFGTAAATFDGAGDYIKVTNFETGVVLQADFTIEAWLWFNQQPSTQTVGGGSYMTLYFSETGVSGVEPYILMKNTTGTNYPTFEYGITQPGGGAAYGSFSSYTGSAITLNTWHHFAICRKSGVWKAYWNGNDMGSYTGTNPGITAEPLKATTNWMGWPQNGRGYWNGKVDEIRVTYGCRYHGPFTPPTEPFVHDSATMMLLHMDGTNGSTTFTDSTS